MTEDAVALLAAILLSVAFLRKVGGYKMTSVIFLWSWIIPDIPKYFLNSNSKILVNKYACWVAIVMLVLLLILRIMRVDKKYLILLSFLWIGLELHLLVDFLFRHF